MKFWLFSSLLNLPMTEEKDKFHDQQTEDQTEDQQWLRLDQRQINTGTHRDKKEPEQKSFKRLNIRLEFVSIFAFGQNDPGQKGAKRRG